jgi:hypothetical protein
MAYKEFVEQLTEKFSSGYRFLDELPKDSIPNDDLDPDVADADRRD